MPTEVTKYGNTDRLNLDVAIKRIDFQNQFFAKITKEDLDLEAIAKEEVITYYNAKFRHNKKCEYDIRFHFDPGYDPKSKHDTVINSQILRENIFKQDSMRKVPVVVSHNYGARKTDLEGKVITCHKKCAIMKEVLRRCKINLKPDKKGPPVVGYETL